MSLLIKTYNILYPYENNNFKYLSCFGKDYGSRSVQILNNIGEDDCDVICLQEIDKNFFNYIKNNLSGFTGYHTNHDGSVNPKADGVAVFFKAKSFTQLQLQTSDNKATNQSKHRTTTARRDITVDLQDNLGKVSRICSVHIEGGPQRHIGDKQLSEILDNLEQNTSGVDQIILIGDLNQDQFVYPNGSRLDILRNRGYLINPSIAEECDQNGQITNRTISHIAVKCINPSLQVQIETKDPTKYIGRTASDHSPVTATVKTLSKRVNLNPSISAYNLKNVVLGILGALGLFYFLSRIFN